jgi:hypothetical protein
MNYVFKKRFHRKLGISELLVECDKVMASLRANELDEDFHSRHKDRVPYIPNLPMLKTTAKSYTRRIYSEFKIEFKDQFLFSGTMLKTKGSISTYMVDRGHSIHSRWMYIQGGYTVSYLKLIKMLPQLLGNYVLMECQIMKT